MRILVDSSVWIDFFNAHISPQRNALAELFDSPQEICTDRDMEVILQSGALRLTRWPPEVRPS